MTDEDILRALFAAALEGGVPDGKFAGRLPPPPKGRTIVIGAGKASARMAAAFEKEWGRPAEGLVITRYGHRMPTTSVEVVEAAHPVPDQASFDAARRMLEVARSATKDDLVVALMSGGASALLSVPADGISLADKQDITRKLLKSGATIGAMNRVRKALSAVKGGRLAAAASPAQVVTYVISDVPGDDPGTVGSGPTVPDRGDPEEALRLLKHHGIDVPDRIVAAIRANRPAPEIVPAPVTHMIATPKMAIDAAKRKAIELGLRPLVLGDAIEGEAREVGTVLAGIAKSVAAHGEPAPRPCVLLSGGETTVTVRGKGRGGRNAEFLLGFAANIAGVPGIAAIAGDTDGIDGSEDNAGAWIDSAAMAEPGAVKEAAARLADNDAYTFFANRNRLVVTGPTLTNVNDFRAILIR